MHIKEIRILFGAVLVLACSPAFADQGYIEKEGVRMPIQDTLVTYDAKLSSLSIYLFPSRLSAEDKQAILNGKDPFTLLWNRSSPDTKKWQWYPYGMLQLRSKHGNLDNLADISGYYLLAYGISKQNYTDNLNGYFHDSNIPSLYKKHGNKIDLKYQGESEFFKIKWNLDIRN